MKAAVFDEIKNIRLIDKEIPSFEADEVVIKVLQTGICGSEIHAYNGMHPFREPPSILGHEVVGMVFKLGSDVAGLKEKDIVTVEPQYGCSKCEYCKRGDYHLCNRKTILGTQKWEGAFAEYITVPASTIYKLPEDVPYKVSVLAEPLAVGVHAVQVAEIEKGDKVAILGSGPIGLLTAVAALHAGAERIVITDTLKHNLEAGEAIGVTDTVDISENSITDYVKEHMGNVDKVFLTVGFETVVEDAFEIVSRKGKIVSIAIFEGKTAIDLNKVFMSEIQILGSSMYKKEDFQEAVNIISQQSYPLNVLTKHTFQLEEINKAMEVAATKKDGAIKVLIDFS
ncbi:zinc-binding dehydrogenase [Oceanobacillus sp. CFH 90083]|uniref:zinc-dependent alcohol dehydrogenase n=1 Tax=Oceanobacillus sp. CFH 90083 TaxID=2592336 RepID=UPI00128C511B|nr:alcohol dehydrogenase catalytic domain-containing protein [Oceanobacillus sp. CFH 90083]